MSDPRKIEADPSAIGGVTTPPFARLPDPTSRFLKRALRLRAYAEVSELKPYLLFLAGLAETQAAVAGLGQDAPAPDPARLARAQAAAMPPVDRAALAGDDTLEQVLDALFDRAATLPQPDPARRALGRLVADRELRIACAMGVLAAERPEAGLAEHAYAAAAVEVHLSARAAKLELARLVPVGTGACPACGGPPIASIVVGWQAEGADGARYCGCALCGTLWNVVRITCTLCGSTEGIRYAGVEGGTETVRAETCDACGRYVKILQGQKDPLVEPVADDVASLGLDLMMAGTRYRRGAYDPYLMGY